MISRFSVFIGSKGKSSAHFNYITASEKYDKKTGVVLTKSGSMPNWAEKEPKKFWQASDEYERANGQAYKEHVLSLPRELSLEQQKIVVDRWVSKELSDKHPFSYAIHHAKARDGGIQPHAHLMFSERKLDGIERDEKQFFKRANKKNPEQGGALKENTGLSPKQMKQNLLAQRQRWGEHLQEHLREFGFEQLADKVDMRNWRERGLSEPPVNKTMSQIQLEKKLDALLEQHPYYIEPKPAPAPKPAPIKKALAPIEPTPVSVSVPAASADLVDMIDFEQHPYYMPAPTPAPIEPTLTPAPAASAKTVKLPVTATIKDDVLQAVIGDYRNTEHFALDASLRAGFIEIDLDTMQLVKETITKDYSVSKSKRREFIQNLQDHATAFLNINDEYIQAIQNAFGDYKLPSEFRDEIDNAFEYINKSKHIDLDAYYTVNEISDDVSISKEQKIQSTNNYEYQPW